MFLGDRAGPRHGDNRVFAPGSRVGGLSAGAGAFGAVAWGLVPVAAVRPRGGWPAARYPARAGRGSWRDVPQQVRAGAGRMIACRLADEPGGMTIRVRRGWRSSPRRAARCPSTSSAAADEPRELVQRGGRPPRRSRGRRPGATDLLIARRQVAQRGTALAVAEDVLDAGPIRTSARTPRPWPGWRHHGRWGRSCRRRWPRPPAPGSARPVIGVQSAAPPDLGRGHPAGGPGAPSGPAAPAAGPAAGPVRRDGDLRILHSMGSARRRGDPGAPSTWW